MKKTTAKVEHRDYVPMGWVAVEFCDVKFYGFRADEMKEKWNAITYKQYQKYDSIYKENETKIEMLCTQANAICNHVKESKPFYRFWHNKAEKKMLANAHKLFKQAYESEEENKKIKNKRFFNSYEYRRKCVTLLQQNGFVLTHTSSRGTECVTETEVWTLEE